MQRPVLNDSRDEDRQDQGEDKRRKYAERSCPDKTARVNFAIFLVIEQKRVSDEKAGKHEEDEH